MPYLADCLLTFIPTGAIPLSLRSYIQGETPLSTWPAASSMTVTYLTIVFGTREIMKDRAPFKLITLFRAHNLLLSVASFVLMLLLGEEVISNWIKLGSYGILCAEEAFTQRLEVYLLINYYFKYYEFVDTIFLALKKKPLTFLHVYHHSATAIVMFVELNGRATVCWVSVVINLGVHVIMYYYYFATAGGARFWWKQYLTTLQITQFIIIFVVSFFGMYNMLAHNFLPMVPHVGDCAGTPSSAFVGVGVVATYLVLFINFFEETYIKPKGITSQKTHASANIDGISSGSVLRVDLGKAA